MEPSNNNDEQMNIVDQQISNRRPRTLISRRHLEIAVLSEIGYERSGKGGQPEINEEDDENYNEILTEGSGSDVDQFDQQIPIPTEEPQEIIKQLEQAMGIQFDQDIIMEILSRLPVQYLVQFKWVSKLWKAIISDPYFKMKNLNHAKNDRDSQKLLFYEHSLKSGVSSMYCCPLSSITGFGKDGSEVPGEILVLKSGSWRILLNILVEFAIRCLLWVLKDNGVKESWNALLTIDDPCIFQAVPKYSLFHSNTVLDSHNDCWDLFALIKSNTDGCRKGNPGEATGGGILRDQSRNMNMAYRSYFGICSNNKAVF
ncbi:hypothetical protein RND71_009194 [Anisodus tanguticus]|uniref:F-box domain-containing protein n=1 Tax=Anisodus tanguticus TaxID=243964 RepID=A0AAE1SFB8_9SOLA|nr:hypothetical protein RND71_009194 [Anisodus tanguticus]